MTIQDLIAVISLCFAVFSVAYTLGQENKKR